MICDKSVYDPAEPEDGLRVLVMQWVRDPSIRTNHNYDLWMRSLGPSLTTLRQWLNGDMSNEDFAQRTRQETSRRAFARLRALERKHGTVTLLCRERRPDFCHRYALIEEYRTLYPDDLPAHPRH